MLNEPRQRVTTYPGTGQVVTAPGASCNVHGWPLGQSIYAKLWLNPPQIATEAFSSDLLPERCPE